MAEFTSENQPKKRKPRGKSQRTLLQESLERLGTSEASFYDTMIMAALGLTEDESILKLQSFAFPEVVKRLYPIPKQVAPTVEFDYPKDGTLTEKASAIEVAISDGVIPPDVGVNLISVLAHVAKIEEVTDLQERIAKIEESLNAQP